jgi:hypothetical protein
MWGSIWRLETAALAGQLDEPALVGLDQASLVRAGRAGGLEPLQLLALQGLGICGCVAGLAADRRRIDFRVMVLLFF